MAEIPSTRTESAIAWMSLMILITGDAVWSPKSKAKKLGTSSASRSVSRPKSAAVKNVDIYIDIADILESKISAKTISTQL